MWKCARVHCRVWACCGPFPLASYHELPPAGPLTAVCEACDVPDLDGVHASELKERKHDLSNTIARCMVVAQETNDWCQPTWQILAQGLSQKRKKYNKKRNEKYTCMCECSCVPTCGLYATCISSLAEYVATLMLIPMGIRT